MERTFTIIKPNAVAAGNAGKIIDMITSDGFRIIGMKLICMSRNEAEKFYATHRGKPFYERLVDFMTCGASIVMILEKDENAVGSLRRLAGKTNPAQADEWTIRHLFGENVTRNAIHASDSEENAREEAAWFFKEKDIIIADYKVPTSTMTED